MNRFRTKRKGKDEAAAAALSAPASPQPQELKSGPFKRFGREKKSQEEEPKKEIDLTNVLPPSDNFRTSLLMTGLSARFSMLREQDDPNTKVGKASDDSVLFSPKRQSRLPEFGYSGGLGDIAEVESLNAVKPSFTRKNSFGSDDAASTASGGIMNRGKPTDGNNLFGGRQKIFKIVGEGRGKVLYEDDVALSAFQKLRLEEKMRRAREEGESAKDDSDAQVSRAPSPSASEFDKRRETTSTMSSTPSIGRNSTAATSITSATASPSLKDWAGAGAGAGAGGGIANLTGPGSAPGPIEGRSVQRTRRLYEQGLNQELHDQQSSALSRIDTLSRRSLATRAAESSAPPPASWAPTALPLPFGERRALGKAGGPDFRTFTPPPPPPTSSPQLPPSDSATAPLVASQPTSSATPPPPTPPISDTEDPSHSPPAPSEGGRATLAGFGKSAQGYDDVQYAQRQLEMSKGRDTPTQQHRYESGEQILTKASSPEWTTKTSELTNGTTPVKSTLPTSFLDSPVEQSMQQQRSPTVNVERFEEGGEQFPVKDDIDSLPTPLSLLSKTSFDGQLPASDGGLLSPSLKSPTPFDSPTLGPTTLTPTSGGLSGMVRHHLRGASNTSSVYGGTCSPPDPKSPDPFESKRISDFAVKPNQQDSLDWGSTYMAEMPVAMSPSAEVVASNEAPPPVTLRERRISQDEFANQLADGARRVRERLTSYVEAEPRSSSPMPESDLALDMPSMRPNPLGILKPRSSRGSLIDRSRTQSQKVKAMNMLGLGATTMTTTPSPRRRSFDEKDKAPIHEEQAPESDHENEQPVHAGLKAFRQAKKELQSLKKPESQPGYQPPPVHPSSALPPRDRRPPPVMYNREPRSRSSSRGPSVRDRSGSETSSGGSRPPRVREKNSNTPPTDDLEPGVRKPPMIRVPGLPGTDIKRSPIMPPPSSARYERSPSAHNLAANHLGQPFRAYDPSQPSPVSLSGLPSPLPSPYHAPYPTPSSPANPLGMPSPGLSNSDNSLFRADESTKRGLRQRDMSQMPTISSDDRFKGDNRDNRGRSGSNAGFAPPLPPINPKRRNVLGAMMNRRGDDSMTSSAPNLSLPPTPGIVTSDDDRSAFSVSDDDEATTKDRRKLLKVGSESVVAGFASRFRGRGGSPPTKMSGGMI